jgi:hypothetical protein
MRLVLLGRLEEADYLLGRLNSSRRTADVDYVIVRR